MLQADNTVLGNVAKVRSVMACYEDKRLNPYKFAMQLEIYNRDRGRSLWLSRIGHIDVIEKFNTTAVECEVLTPTEDYVVTEVFISSRVATGVTYVELTFSEDFEVHEDPSR